MTEPDSRHATARLAAVRVALVATATVAVVYALIAVGTLVIVSQQLTSAIDDRLGRTLAGISQHPSLDPFRRPVLPGEPGGQRFGPSRVVWIVLPDGVVSSSNLDVALPPEHRRVGGPQTIKIGDEEFRVEGQSVGDHYVVVGQSMQGVRQAQFSLARAELLVAPILLATVFGGAFTVGFRVAAPIERAHRRQLEFTADASHELRTPLSVIEAEASLALTRRHTVREYREILERVDVEARRMRRLVDDMLWLARFDAGVGRRAGRSESAEPVDLGILAALAVDRFQAVAETREQRLELEANEGLVVAAPPSWIDRVLGVLLDNACRYAPPGGLITVRVKGVESGVRLTVEDSGPGIPEAERPRIFDRFHRASEAPGGAGLGLAIANAVVGVTDGRWEIGASPLGGASMAIVWPRSW